MRRASAILLSLLFALGGTACNSGSDENRLTEEQFVSQANAICTEGNAAIDEAVDEMVADGGSPSDEEAQELIDLILTNVRGQLDDIEELSPPEDLEADVDELISSARGEADALEEAGVAAIETGEPPFEESNAKAGELGLDACAED